METGLYFSVQIGELPKSIFDVVEFNLEEALSELFTLTLTLSSHDANIALSEQLLQKVTFTVYVNGEKQRTIHGIVAGATRGDIGFHRTFYTIVVRPTLWQLTLTKDSRIYHFKSVPDIIDEILQDFSIAFNKQLMDSHSVREYTTMKRESYYQFLERLAAEEGILFWFEEDKLFYSDSHLGMTTGPNLVYNPHPQASTREHVISQLSFSSFMRPTEAKVKDYRYSHPDVAMNANSKTTKALPIYSVYDSYGRYYDEKTAEQFAKYRLDALQADSELGEAVSNCIQLTPGKIFELAEHPSTSLNDRWQIVRIHHRGTLPQSLDNESDASPAVLTNSFTFIPGRNDWRPLFIHKPLADGDEIATVVGPAGEEIYVNEDGAVKVHFHWNHYDAANENASCWVRVMQNWNGDGFGFLATPRIGQEVIVSYLNGDIDRPIITGTVYNGNNRPPVALPKNKTQMSIKSKTHKGEGFNELRFEDENGKQEIYIHAQKDQNIEVLNNETIWIGNDRSERVEHDETIVIGNDRTERVCHNELVEIENDRKHHIVNDDILMIDRERVVVIGHNHQEDVHGSRTETIHVNHTINDKGSFDHSVGDQHRLKANTKIEQITQLYELKAQDSIILQSPGGRITLNSSGIILDGTIQIRGSIEQDRASSLQTMALQGNKLQSSVCVSCWLKSAQAHSALMAI